MNGVNSITRSDAHHDGALVLSSVRKGLPIHSSRLSLLYPGNEKGNAGDAVSIPPTVVHWVTQL